MSATKPVLYYTPRSPPCRAVMLTAAALGVELEYVIVNLKAGEHLTPEFLKLNPQHTIPVLVDGDVVISDSHVIASYLADTYGNDDSLYPKDPVKRRLVDTRMNFDCGHLFPRGRFMIEPIIYFGAPDIPADRIEYMIKAYDGVERCLAQSNYLAGDTMTIADLCSVATLSTTNRFAPIDAAKFPKLAAWLQRMSQLPYYQEKNAVGLDILEKFIRDLIAERKQASA